MKVASSVISAGVDKAIKGVSRLLESNSELERLLSRIRDRGGQAVIFGGAVRDVALRANVIPRDIDVVVDKASERVLEQSLAKYCFGRTRFGGYRLRVEDRPVDVWRLADTWAFQAGHVRNTGFDALPRTTPFNLEAVAVGVSLDQGVLPRIHECGFFTGLALRVLEVNLVENPHPSLTVIRALVLARRHRLKLGKKLVRYLGSFAEHFDADLARRLQLSHYRRVVLAPERVIADLQFLAQHNLGDHDSARLPVERRPELRLPFESVVDGRASAPRPGRTRAVARH